MNFNDYWLLKEGFLELPRKVIQPIIDYYQEMARKFAGAGRLRSSEKEFPPKTFVLNLTGTKYEHLQNYVPITVAINANDDSHYKGGSKPFIALDFNTPTGQVIHTIEHEVLHHIQKLYQYHLKKKGYRNADLGGLPPRNVRRGDVDSRGYIIDRPDKDKSSFKRVEHHTRPIEAYTNLNTGIRAMQYYYDLEHTPKPYPPDEIKQRTEFMKKYLSEKSTSKNFVFQRAREDNPELYKLYLKTAYKAFVYGENPLDAKNISEFKTELEELRRKAAIEKSLAAANKKPKVPSEKFADEAGELKYFADKKPFSIPYYDRMDFSELPDGNADFGEYVFDKLPYTKQKWDEDSGEEVFRMSMKWPHLKAIFGKIKALKNENRVEEYAETQHTYDYFAKHLFNLIMRELDWRGQFKGEMKENLFNKLYS